MAGQRKAILSGVFWKFGERVIAQLIAFVISIILARILDPDAYGLIAMVTVFTVIANVFVASGFSAALIQKKDASDLDFSTIFYCSLLTSLILYAVLFFAAPLIAAFFDQNIIEPIIRVYGLILIISSFNSVQSAYVSRHMIFKKFFYSSFWASLISGVLAIIVVLLGGGVWALVTQSMSSLVVSSIVLLILVPWRPRLLFSSKRAKKMISFGWKVLAADLIAVICNNLRSLLVGKCYSAAELAYFNRGQSFPDLICDNVQNTLSAVLFPAMSNVSDAIGEVREMLRKSVRLISFVMFPLMIMLIVVAEPLVMVLLTEKWVDCVIFLQLIALAKLIETVVSQNLQALKAIGRSDVVLKLEFIKKPIFVLLVIVSVNINMLAVGISWPVYSVIATIINMFPNKKYFGYNYRDQLKDIAAPLFMSLAMAIPMILISFLPIAYLPMLLFECIVGGGIYILLSKALHISSYSYIKTLMHEAFSR